MNKLSSIPKPASGLKVNVQEINVKKPLVDITKEIQKVDLQSLTDENKKDALLNQHNMQLINDKIKMKVLSGELKSIGGGGPPSGSSKSNSEHGS